MFTDWCAVTGRTPLPAAPETLLAFLADCSAAPATLARRVSAIDHHHRHAGVNPPQRTREVRDLLRGRPAQPVREEFTDAQVDAALRRLPSHGWTNGWFGRRDRALLVLTHRGGLPYRRIAALTAGDIQLADGAATMATPTGSITLQPADDPVLCGPCALARWLRVVHLAITSPATRTLAGVIDRAPALDALSPHLCRSRRPLTHGIEDVPLLPPINPRGHLAMTPAALTTHSPSTTPWPTWTGAPRNCTADLLYCLPIHEERVQVRRLRGRPGQVAHPAAIPPPAVNRLDPDAVDLPALGLYYDC